MLILDPPISRNEWTNTSLEGAEFEKRFANYCGSYVGAVLALPNEQIAKLLAHLSRDLELDAFGPDSFHRVVERELADLDTFESSSKVATLIVLCALANTLNAHGFEIHEKTARLLWVCHDLIPVILTLAIDDHFGLLQTQLV